MPNYVYPAIALIGGGTGALDAIDGTNLADKDMAIVSVQGDKTYFYVLDVDSAAAEASPGIIAPDANGGDKRWILTGFTPVPAATGFTIAGGTTSKTLTVDETVAMSSKAPKASPSFSTGIGIGGVAAGTGGVAFPATAVAVADVNTLDDYEEGTFAAAMECGTSGTITLNASYDTLSYTKIGRQVTVMGILIVGSVSSPVGSLRITGLPFANHAGTEGSARAAVMVAADGLNATAATAMQGYIMANETRIFIEHFAAGVAAAAAADIKAGSVIMVNGTYFTN